MSTDECGMMRTEAFVPDPEFWMSWHVCQVIALVSRGSFCKNKSQVNRRENILHDSHERWCPDFNSLLKKKNSFATKTEHYRRKNLVAAARRFEGNANWNTDFPRCVTEKAVDLPLRCHALLLADGSNTFQKWDYLL